MGPHSVDFIISCDFFFLLLVFNKTEGERENCYHSLGHFLVTVMEV